MQPVGFFYAHSRFRGQIRGEIFALAAGFSPDMLNSVYYSLQVVGETVMPLLIKNGEIVTASERYRADIWCAGETITSIGPNLPAPPGAEVIDAAGKLVFPGFIDPHVHIYLPFMGTFAKDTYSTASRAALVGGTTTLIEMVCPARGDDPLEAYELWKSKAAGQSACDYAFHMGVTRFDERTPDQLRKIVDDGTASFKIFLAYKGAFGVDDAELYRTLELAKRWASSSPPIAKMPRQSRSCSNIAGGRQNGPGVARTFAAAGGRGRRRASPGHICRTDRRACLRRSHIKLRCAARSPSGTKSRRADVDRNGHSVSWSSIEAMPRNRTSKARST